MIRAKYSNSYQAKKYRIKRVPRFTGDAVRGMLKRDANRVIEIFHDGIKNDTFNLEYLSDATVQNKEYKGYSQPETPLYGAGDESDDRSYVNMLRIRQLKNGWKVYPSTALHHEARIPLNVLFKIHEFGAKITTKNGSIIQIPPRPALLLAYKQLLREIRQSKKEMSRDVKSAINELINTAESQYLNYFIKLKDNKEHTE